MAGIPLPIMDILPTLQHLQHHFPLSMVKISLFRTFHGQYWVSTIVRLRKKKRGPVPIQILTISKGGWTKFDFSMAHNKNQILVRNEHRGQKPLHFHQKSWNEHRTNSPDSIWSTDRLRQPRIRRPRQEERKRDDAGGDGRSGYWGGDQGRWVDWMRTNCWREISGPRNKKTRATPQDPTTESAIHVELGLGLTHLRSCPVSRAVHERAPPPRSATRARRRRQRTTGVRWAAHRMKRGGASHNSHRTSSG
jgi:hypothetical protein